jgi:prepilin-type N-terminal cleavage/methylation domain-containing protein
MLARRKGFTLIELLVVIAIIVILAAMLFPVFARAGESARKTQCLSNVKNIATAVQMYLTDYDRMPPTDHSAEAHAYFNTIQEDCSTITHANPYLRWPVIFDEYVKNRDVWRCPSARIGKGAFVIVWPVPSWLDWYKRWEGTWSRPAERWALGGGPCGVAFPTGWGGSVTDSHA